ncbi:MAG: flavodoxin family protein [Clostridiales bacterium]|nr:flavodoxin family protein [Clostridiales bacterium]
MDRILFVSASAKNGSCKALLEELQTKFWLQHSTEVVHIRDYPAEPCCGCEACFATDGECVKQDKIHILMEKILDAKIVVFATPNYFYNMSGLAKTFVDRTYRYYTNKALHGKKFIYLYTGEDTPDNIKKYLDNAMYGFNVCHNINVLGSFAVSTEDDGVYKSPADKEQVISKITKLITENL